MNKSMNIITSLCFDDQDESFNYQLYYLSNKQKRLTYWKCCVVFFATAYRTNPGFKRILYTNDQQDMVYGNIDMKGLLQRLGVEINYLPSHELEKFRGDVKYHFPTLYKFLVIREISKLKDNPTLFLDSDCVWTKPFDTNSFDFEKPVLYDVYQKTDIHDKRHNKLSRAEIGSMFKKIDRNYPEAAPILFGGEILGGGKKVFGKISLEIENYLTHIANDHLANSKFTDGKSILDGDEFVLSMVYNKYFKDYQPGNAFIKRIWTMKRLNTTNHHDLDLTVWHVISEKLKGIPCLFNQIIDENSEFWTTPIAKFNLFLGYYLNIPERKAKLNTLLETRILYQKILFKLKTNAFF
jgi:hypothetical protein